MTTVYIVHCIDTEGPLYESMNNTFSRLREIYSIDLKASKENLEAVQSGAVGDGFNNADVAKTFSKNNLSYNSDWSMINEMVDELTSDDFRNSVIDSNGGGWVYSWHCLDHLTLDSRNPRRKDIGLGRIQDYYRAICESSRDEINFHFHPISVNKSMSSCGTSYENCKNEFYSSLNTWVIDFDDFPTCFRPGFHTERSDSNLLLEQWIPYDYANQFYESETTQPDLSGGRFGDWRRASASWTGYHPSYRDYQVEGEMRRTVFRCLNVGTRFNTLKYIHVEQAIEDARKHGGSILSFSNHDYRDMRPDVRYVQAMVQKAMEQNGDVKFVFAGAREAAAAITGDNKKVQLDFDLDLNSGSGILKVILRSGEFFGPQPYLVYELVTGEYIHDSFNSDGSGHSFWYSFDNHTFKLGAIRQVAVASNGVCGTACVRRLFINVV